MSIYRRIANLLSRSQLEQEIDKELRAHIQMRIDDNIAAGMSPGQARRDALIRFGNPAALKEQAANADTHLVLDNLARDFRYAARQLRHSPGFASIAILTLALAIAANVAVFSILNAVILKPLNVAHSERLFNVVQKPHGFFTQSWPDFNDYRRLNSTFSDMAAYRLLDLGISTGGTARKAWAYEVSGNYFDMLGIQPVLGHFFHASDEHGPNSAPFVVLSNAYWRARFNANPAVLGTIVDINKHPFTIIGVAPAGFHGTEIFIWPDFWLPLVNEQQIEGFDWMSKRFNHVIVLLGELNPGVSVQRASDNLNAIAAQLAKLYPATDEGMGARLIKPGLYGDALSGPTHAFLAGIMTLAFLVLLAACANLAGIFAARVTDRSRELAVRLAIGCSRWHVLRQLLSEALLIAFAGGFIGTLFATALLKGLSGWRLFAGYPIHVTVLPDARVYAIAILLSIASGLAPGLLPARQIWHTDVLDAMKSNVPRTAVFRRFTLRDLLLGLQIAVCALLLTASLVALRGMQRSLHAPLGFQPAGAVLANTDLHMAGYSDESGLAVQERMLDAAARLPGIAAAGVINETPLGTGGSNTPVFREDTKDLRSSNTAFGAKYYCISPGYFRAASTRLLAGRDFTWHDGAKAPKVALVNETFAHTMFPNAAAVGRRFAMADKSLYEIVGVVEDGKYDSLTEPPQPAMFLSLAQNPDSDTVLVLRTWLTPAETARALDAMLARIDPNLPFTIHSWPEALGIVLFPARAATASLGVMGLLAAMLAITGVFGIAAYSVSKRMKELGIRIALGARRAQLMWSALARPLVLLIAGSAAGLLSGVLAGRLLAQIVYETTPRDPIVLSSVVLAMALIGIVATWIPARRALRIDPAALLKDV